MSDVDRVKLAYIINDYDRLAAQVLELGSRQRTSEAIDARRSSIEVGTPAKGGAIKVYFDPFAPATENDRAIEEALRVLGRAGGKVNGGA